MIRIAVLVTVFNRCDITLKGLQSLHKSIEHLYKNNPLNTYIFDIWMTDDGSTDDTYATISRNYPDVHLIQGNGSLYWNGGMRKAWQAALASGIQYDFFLWFNDDSELYDDAIQTMFESIVDDNIVTGAFCDHNGHPSYGGRDNNNCIIAPNGYYQEVRMMNGNLVLIPFKVYSVLGILTPNLKHCGGDFDYGYRAQKNNIKVLLSNKYVGMADRHDEIIPKYCLPNLKFISRWKVLHNPVYSPFEHFKFNIRYKGFFFSVKSLLICYIGVLFPNVYAILKEKQTNQ